MYTHYIFISLHIYIYIYIYISCGWVGSWVVRGAFARGREWMHAHQMLYIFQYTYPPWEGAWVWIRTSPTPHVDPNSGRRFYDWFGWAVEFLVIHPGHSHAHPNASVRQGICLYVCMYVCTHTCVCKREAPSAVGALARGGGESGCQSCLRSATLSRIRRRREARSLPSHHPTHHSPPTHTTIHTR